MRKFCTAIVGAIAAMALAQPAMADDRGTLERYADGTWRSFAAMTDEQSGLPADSYTTAGTASVETSTTNIGAYMWSAVAAERLGIIGHRELVSRLRRTIASLEGMERHEPSGQFYNWYDHRTGAKITTGTPILSSVDNGWLAVGLKIVANRVPELSRRADAIYDSMDFGFYYRPAVNRILFHYVPDTGAEACCYDTYVSESRIATYIGISKGEIPAKAVYGTFRAFPSCLETAASGPTHAYFGVSVFDGALPYNGTMVTPSWGGSMFEALMPDLFVPEERWAPGSWGVNHPLTVDAHCLLYTSDAADE